MPTTKQSLLQALQQGEGAFCSGQALADTLGVSRAAVHKAAAVLQAQGWQIEAISRKGYRLMGQCDVFCAEGLGEYPYPTHIFDNLPSTNKHAKQLAIEGAPHGTLVLAAAQTAGRGRLGRGFYSPANSGIYMTLLLRPALQAVDALPLTTAAAVAVCRAVEEKCGISLAIKWVNDLYYKDKKVCGILSEAATDFETGTIDWVAVGIGLNLTTTAFDETLAPIATSLYPDGSAPISRAALAGEIARQLLALAPDYNAMPAYQARCFTPGHWVTVHAAQETYPAKAIAIDESGRLIVERENGQRTALAQGEVSVRPAGIDY
ncbi:MAG: biotin--[acetyl-CoA-carboxylase] ligase [Faecalibacterium sp.]